MLTNDRIAPAGKICFSLFAGMVFLAGCGSTAPRYTKQDLEAVKLACTRQAHTEREAKVANWFTRWLGCLNERVLPIEIELNHANESEIRRVYEKSSALAPKVDSGEMSLRSYNAEMQEFKEGLFNIRCLVSVEQTDGSERCINYQRAKWR